MIRLQMTPPLDWCFYRLTPSGGTKPQAPQRTHQKALDFVALHGKKQSLYIFTDDASNINLDDYSQTIRYSGLANCNIHVLRRLMEVRQGWSKK